MKNFKHNLKLSMILSAVSALAVACGDDTPESLPVAPAAPVPVPGPAPQPAPLPQPTQTGDYIRSQVIPMYQSIYGNIIFRENSKVIGNGTVLITEIPAGPRSWMEIYDNVVVKLAQSGCGCYNVLPNGYQDHAFWLGVNFNSFNGYIGGYSNSWISNTVTFEKSPTLIVDIYSVINMLINNAYSIYGQGGYYSNCYTVPYNTGYYYGGGYAGRPYIPGTYVGGNVSYSQGGGGSNFALGFGFSKVNN